VKRAHEADVEGSPDLVVREEDRETVAELLADLLIAALEPESREGEEIA
jgi:hypothetical protein